MANFDPTEQPGGLVYRPELVDSSEERDLLAFLETLDFREIVMRGQTARRTTRHYGWAYGYESRELEPGDPLPAELEGARARCADLANVAPEALAQTLVSRYPPGAGIGWHRDAPMFGAVVGLSLGSACRLRFQRGKDDARRTFDFLLEPRSGYVLAGAARSAWQHSIPATKELRFSITFRTFRKPERWQS